MAAYGFDRSVSMGYTDSAEVVGRFVFHHRTQSDIVGKAPFMRGLASRTASATVETHGGCFAMDQEQWKAISGYEGIYEISTFGRVKSLERKVADGINRTKTINERIKSQGRDRDGYLGVGLSLDGTQITVKVHRLVLIAFSGEQPPGCQTSHIDHDKKNNNIGNLAWVTQSENRRHSLDCGRRPGIAKNTPEIAKMIREVYALGQHSHSQIGLMFGICKSTAGNIIRGKIWRRAGGPITRLGEVVKPPDTRWE